MQWLHKLLSGTWVKLWSSTSRLLGMSRPAIARADLVFLFLLPSLISSFLFSLLPSPVFIHLLFVIHRVQPPLCATFHVPLLSHLDLQALLHAPSPKRRPTLLSTTYTPSLSRRHITSVVLFFSMSDPDVTHTTRFPFPTIFDTDPSALLNVRNLKCHCPQLCSI